MAKYKILQLLQKIVKSLSSWEFFFHPFYTVAVWNILQRKQSECLLLSLRFNLQYWSNRRQVSPPLLPHYMLLATCVHEQFVHYITPLLFYIFLFFRWFQQPWQHLTTLIQVCFWDQPWQRIQWSINCLPSGWFWSSPLFDQQPPFTLCGAHWMTAMPSLLKESNSTVERHSLVTNWLTKLLINRNKFQSFN